MSLKHFTTKTKPPEHDGLYRYTSGRWLIDEERQISQRFMKFDIGKLCCLAASLLEGKPTCIRVDKLEGKSNRAFLLTMDDGREVIAKLPYPAFGPKFHSTASEVATMKFLHLYTTIPVPKVLAWSSESANDVGAEYIIMEKIPGVALSELWEGLSTLERYNLIERIVAMEKELASLEFPAYGALYLRDSIPAGLKRFPLSGPLDYEELFCVGPSYHRCAWYESLETFPNNMDAGPWPALKDFAISSVQRELEAIDSSKAESKHHVKILNDFQSLNEYRVLLEKASSIIPILSSDSRVRDVSKPVLWHTGLRLENVFVSTNDPTHIQGIIGWRSSQISPLFLQSSFPEFLATPSFYAFSDELPSLSGFSELGPEKQQRALKIRELAARSKYYEMCIVEYNELVYDAMKLDRKLLMPFQCCQLFSTGGLVRLRNSLICISKDWATLGLAGHCPFTFTAEELVKHEEQVAPHEDALKLMELVKDQLSTGDEGWVPAERWESTNQRNKVLFDQFTKSLSENSSHETASRKWPFPPREA